MIDFGAAHYPARPCSDNQNRKQQSAPMADQLFRIIAALDSHFASDDQLPADADRWRELKRHIVRMKDGLDLARIELESFERGAPQTKEIARKALQHVKFGLGEKPG
jgi:hypothetical protein